MALLKGIGQLNLHIYAQKRTGEEKREKKNILIRLSPFMWNADICRVRQKTNYGHFIDVNFENCLRCPTRRTLSSQVIWMSIKY